MSRSHPQAAIVGVYATEQAKTLPQPGIDLQLEAIRGALAEAGLSVASVDGVLPSDTKPYSTALVPPREFLFWGEQLGHQPLTFTSTGHAPGALAKAAAAIDAGMCNVVVAFYGKSGWRIGPSGVPIPDRAPRVPEWSFEISGAFMTPLYALWAQRYMHEFKVTSEDLAQVAVIHREHAMLKPDSLMGSRGPLTVDDVVNSRMISDPLHLFDCAIDNDGGWAVVLASPAVARDCKTKPIWLLGGAEGVYTDFYASHSRPWFPEEGYAVRRAADLAFEMSGVTRDEIDVAGLYDCFTITMIRDLEEMGFCKIGEGADYVREGHTRLGGSMPCNTDGGLLSNSHCGVPSGLHIIEVVRQLRGECGARQVPDASIGAVLAQGRSVHGEAAVMILGAD
jgi:acetyl-CoA acetyltransferase